MACSLRLAAIEYLERVKDPAGLAPQGCFIAAEAIEREIWKIGEPHPRIF